MGLKQLHYQLCQLYATVNPAPLTITAYITVNLSLPGLSQHLNICLKAGVQERGHLCSTIDATDPLPRLRHLRAWLEPYN